MTDFSKVYNCNDLITLMAKYLSPEDLNSLRQASKIFKNKISTVTVLQPLYNKLYRIDKTLPARIDASNPFESFKHAFEKICKSQNNEFSYLKKHKTDCQDIPANSIEDLEKREDILNQINIDKIDNAIKNSLDDDALNLFSIGITRFIVSEDKKLYFSTIKKLYLDRNDLTDLSLTDCIALEEIYCSNNKIKSITFNQEAPIKIFHCSQNQLNTLNFEGLSYLKDLECSFNDCHTLNLENCTQLESIYCRESSQSLRVLNLFNCSQLNSIHIGNGDIDSLLLTELNIEACSQQIQNRFADKHEAVLFDKLSHAAYFERDVIIKSLGERYNLKNCLKYGCLYDAGLITSLKFQSINTFLPSVLLLQNLEDAPNDTNEKMDNGQEGTQLKIKKS